ncbi:EAL domain-containing protein [Phaeovulum sp.]|uniref:EAL domain-containing protein n=1 Tax=Phaeovulum sp. TaxID=2934796 RepID=UPI0039E4E184
MNNVEEPGRDGATGLPLRSHAVAALHRALAETPDTGRGTAALVLGIDQPDRIADTDEILRRTADRIRGALRDADVITRLDGARFAIVLKPTVRPDLESMIQLAARLQSATEAPLSVDMRTIHVTTHIGFCLISRTPERTGEAMLHAAITAADDAAHNPPSAIRAYSTELQKATQAHSTLSSEVAAALEDGTIVAHFQPQLSTDTGKVSGFQVVPCWLHPERGLLHEPDISPVIEAAGIAQRLMEVMLYNTFSAIRGWDSAGVAIGAVSIHVTTEQLLNPKLPEWLRWQLDRFDVPADRLRLVITQKIAGQLDHDIVALNLSTCAQMGVHIELAGFGEGPISMTSIRRTAAKQVRLDRSFVTRVDTDPEQQRLVAAILSMAAGIGVDTIAEEVATIGEHAILAQLGCDHVLGPAIARPMPYDETISWLQRHNKKLDATPRMGRERKR